MTNQVTNVVQSIPVVGGDLAPAASWLSEHGMEMLGRCVAALVILILGGIVVKLATIAFHKALQKSKRVNPLLEKFLASVASKTGWAVVLMLVLGKLGVDVGPLVAGLGVTGFIVGFACQESLSNLAAGIMIALNQPFKVGDYIIAGGVEGSVLELNMMAAVLATADNKRVTVPNKSVWGGPITNFSALGKRRVDTVVGIAYGSDIEKAVRIAREAVVQVPGVLEDPAPAVAVASLDASAVMLNVRPWANCADYWAVYSGAQRAVKEAFDKNGVRIPFQQIDVHVKNA
jgi:small conductance mechanosensitive channel